MFYSAIAQDDVCRKAPTIDHQGDDSYWRVVPVAAGVECHFALLRDDTDPMGRIICALTGSPAYHAETLVDEDGAPLSVLSAAEAALSPQPRGYDYEGALRAWDDQGFHSFGREFCSGYAYEMLKPLLPGLTPYPNPGRLLSDLTAMTNQQGLAAGPVSITVGESDMGFLEQLRDEGTIATGTMQQAQQALRVSGSLVA